jgi:hypothetical protein
MSNEYKMKVNDFYTRNGIYPSKFRCPNQAACRPLAYQGRMTEAKMSMVGSLYGQVFPKVIVVSLDPPAEEDNVFLRPEQRTTEYIARIHENQNYSISRPGPHWAMTLIIVKDLLSLWGYQARADAVTVHESYSGRFIENVSAYFTHVNISKCSMNNPGRRQSPELVQQLCSRRYLLDELKVLEPDIMVTQGAATNRIMGNLLVGKEVFEEDLPKSEVIRLADKPVLWLPMHHPTQQLNKIRAEWPAYLRFLRNWAKL